MNQSRVANLLNKSSRGGYSNTVKECVGYIERKEKASIFTPNSEMIYCAARSYDTYKLLLSASILFPDGVGIFAGMKLLGHDPIEKTCGIDLAEALMTEAVKRNYKIFLLGARPGVASKAAYKLKEKYNGLRICGYHHGYFNKSGVENKEVIELIDRSGADILFVCFGFPEQEKWICRNFPQLRSVKLAVGLGGSLDVWSGKVNRAPSAVSDMGFEWLWRTAQDPKRLPRLFNLLGFSFFILKEVIKTPRKQYNCYEIDNFLK